MELYQELLTSETFETEQEAWAALDAAAVATGCFKIHREVRGFYVQPRHGTEIKDPRIDRILQPTKKLLEAGWPHGPIGVECKHSGKKAGRAIAQAQDYTRACFLMPNGYRIMLEWVFIWPLDGAGGDVGSVMAQNRIGWVTRSNRDVLRFGCGGTTGIECRCDGTVAAKRLPMGNKAGSR